MTNTWACRNYSSQPGSSADKMYKDTFPPFTHRKKRDRLNSLNFF